MKGKINKAFPSRGRLGWGRHSKKLLPVGHREQGVSADIYAGLGVAPGAHEGGLDGVRFGDIVEGIGSD